MKLCIVLSVLLISSVAFAAHPLLRDHDALRKLDDFVHRKALAVEDGAEWSVLLSFEPQRHVSSFPKFNNGTRGERVSQLVRHLRERAGRMQGDVLSLLNKLRVEHTPFWVANVIQVNVNLTTLHELARHPHVHAVEQDESFQADLELPEFVEAAGARREARSGGVEQNVAYIHAPEVWHTGITGEDLVLAHADTGVQYNHPALRNNYRGASAGGFSHHYNWWDPVKRTAHRSRCGGDSSTPCDDHGHGTHTCGTAVGSDGGRNLIGVAPGAKWIACRNMDAGVGKPSYYMSCLQFFVAPTRLDGTDPRPELAAHVVTNSYGCPPEEGCSPASLTSAVNAVVANGIFFVASAGNTGPRCGTVSSPPAIIDQTFSVAAAQKESDSIASFSSRGPVVVDGSLTPKPDITAPGSGVRSAYPQDTYATLSGTSMACPAVAGSVLLLWESDPSLVGDIEATRTRLWGNARPMHSSVCGSRYSSSDPRDYSYGRGMINAYAAVLNQNHA